MSHFPILSLVTFLPIVGAVFILTIRGEDDVVARNARNVALWDLHNHLRVVALHLDQLRHGHGRLPVR